MKKKIKFLIVLNLNTVIGSKLSLVNKVAKILRQNHEVIILKTQDTKDAKDIFKNISVESFDRMVIAGGDGSVNFAINELLQDDKLKDKIIGIIPVGTANILQIESKNESQPEKICNVLVSSKTRRISLLKMNDSYFFLMAGVGFDSDIVYSVNKINKRFFKKFIFFIKGLQHFIFLKNDKKKVKIGDEVYFADWIICSNSKYFGGPYSISKEIDIFNKDVIFYIFKDLTRLKILKCLWSIFRKEDFSLVKNLIVKRNNLITIEKVNKKMKVQIDGEIINDQDKIIVQKSDKFFDLLTP